MNEITTAQAIAWFESRKTGIAIPGAMAMYNKAIAALRAQLEAEQNELLTLDELREMDGEPVWMIPLEDEPDWTPHWEVMQYGYVCANSVAKIGKTYFYYPSSYGGNLARLPTQAEGGKSMSEWINVKDKMPEENEDVLVFIQAGDSSWFDVSWHTRWGWRKHELELAGVVTHWAPIPAPPTKGRKT